MILLHAPISDRDLTIIVGVLLSLVAIVLLLNAYALYFYRNRHESPLGFWKQLVIVLAIIVDVLLAFVFLR